MFSCTKAETFDMHLSCDMLETETSHTHTHTHTHKQLDNAKFLVFSVSAFLLMPWSEQRHCFVLLGFIQRVE
jgi:hypothetical protein